MKEGWFIYKDMKVYVQKLGGVWCYWNIETGWKEIDNEKEFVRIT